MASSVSDTFTCFLKLPAELRLLVWKQAAADLSVLDIQRFTAEIVLGKQNNDPGCPTGPVLFFTPHADLRTLTADHRRLLGTCLDSRRAALKQIPRILKTRYLVMDTDGNLLPRQARIPFNPSGHFCIGGLGRAMLDASQGRGARGSRLSRRRGTHEIRVCKEFVDSELEIENLMIALDRRPYPTSYPWSSYMHGFDHEGGFEDIAAQFPHLRTASLLGEAILGRRHYIDQSDFTNIRRSVAVVPMNQRRFHQKAVDWRLLWGHWKRLAMFLNYS